MTDQKHGEGILILGLGELGTAIVNAFLLHPLYTTHNTPISVMIRPSTILSPAAEKATQLHELKSQGVTLIAGDIEKSSLLELTTLFTPFHTVIHAGAMNLKSGTQLKVTQAVLATGTNKLYIPWQFGVDYDIITRSGGQGLFTEQLDVRDLLRSQNETHWLIISCGIFMSFLFEPFWGVVEREHSRAITPAENAKTKITRVRALGSWDDLLTATTAEDIGACTADVVLNAKLRNQTVYIAGDSLKYEAFADAIDKFNGGDNVERGLWSTEHLKQESEADPDDKLKKYRVVFSEGKGLAWPKAGTYNDEQNIKMTGFKDYLRRIES